ncbi:hypothetical protein Micbo1qcDRAFT_201748 [Microdochium bolleyi]|uniref:Uncharacterized protein n=1 Tax=Microdochium bolleyi TaxID=196109 RepID=A0A136J9H6_9PEZI|nr:hypothetical protein Micbo1qcDRAFT_201748 [Microdochium bolleyi]
MSSCSPSPDQTPKRRPMPMVVPSSDSPLSSSKSPSKAFPSLSPSTACRSLSSTHLETPSSPPWTPQPRHYTPFAPGKASHASNDSSTNPIYPSPQHHHFFFDLDSPNLPLHAAAWPATEMSSSEGLVCRFRAIHTPPHLAVPLNFAALGDVIEDTPEHLHINVRFEHLHMVHTIKQAWVNRHTKPDADCVLCLGAPVLDERSERPIHLRKWEGCDLIHALLPREAKADAVGAGEENNDAASAESVTSTTTAAAIEDEQRSQEKDMALPTKTATKRPSLTSICRPSMVHAETQTDDDLQCNSTHHRSRTATPADDRAHQTPVTSTSVSEGTEAWPLPPGTASFPKPIVLEPRRVQTWADILRKR